MEDEKRMKAKAARSVALHYEQSLRGRLKLAGVDALEFDLEITACGSAEGDDFNGRLDCVYLEQITIYQGGRGIGRQVMKTAITLADERCLTLVLEAASQKFDERHPWWRERLSQKDIDAQAFRLTSLSQEELTAWYERLGFITVSENSLLMQRPPIGLNDGGSMNRQMEMTEDEIERQLLALGYKKVADITS